MVASPTGGDQPEGGLEPAVPGTGRDMSEVSGQGHPRELPIGELVSRLSQQVSQLVRDELQLALAELKQKGKQAGMGAGLTWGSGLIEWTESKSDA